MLRFLWTWISRQIITDVPPQLSGCVDCPHDLHCTLEQSATCRLRIEHEAAARKERR